MNKGMADKFLILGVDGFDPSLTKKFLDMGVMPNLQRYISRGSAREDLVLLGAVPTVTPPMWTTLATGAYPRTHGIVSFFNPHPERYETSIYALDSRMCKAEPLWDVFAEAGKKTLVWHWPGSSWPPTSDSPNLHVVDGTQPVCINMGVAIIDWEKIGTAGTDIKEVNFLAHDAEQHVGAGCIIMGIEDIVAEADEALASGAEFYKAIHDVKKEGFTMMAMGHSDTEVELLGNVSVDIINSPIKEPVGWSNAPEGAREFTMITSAGYVRRPCLILRNQSGVYDRVAVYKSKRDTKPIIVLEKDVYTTGYVDEILVGEEIKVGCRNMRILEIAEDGSRVRFWMSEAIDINYDNVFHPKSLMKDIQENVGYIPPIAHCTARNQENAEKLQLASWDVYCEWQADCLTYLMDNKDYDVIFSHLHNVDMAGHQFYHLAKHREKWGNDETFYQGLIQAFYEQTDRYLGRFLEYLDKGYTIIITSDHGLIAEENEPPVLGEGTVNVPVMRDLGYTVMKKDEDGKDLRQIDWSKTKAISVLFGNVWLNLKGRRPYGIVDPGDQYELEAEIISALYNYRDPKTGKRVVSLALRNRDAIVLGLGGPLCGDIVYFMEEGFNVVHANSLATQRGYFNTSVSPIFVAAGKGIKEGYTTERDIRQVDVTPTLAVLGGVRMPAQCEGAPIYQILEEVY